MKTPADLKGGVEPMRLRKCTGSGWVLVAVVVLHCVLVGCETRPSSPPNVSPPSLASSGAYLTGQVLLANVPAGGHLGILVYLAGTSYNAHTDENGKFTISNVPAGEYTVVAEYPGYQKVTIERVSLIPQQHTRERPYETRMTILERVDSPLTTATTQRKEPLLGSLRGEVTVLGSRSNEGVVVRLEDTPLVTITDELGVYRFLNVEHGAYRLSIEKPGYRRATINVVVIGGEETKADAVVLEPVGSGEDTELAGESISRESLQGDRKIIGVVRIFDAQGLERKDYEHVTLALDNSDYIVTPDEQGNFEFSRLPAGLYTVLATLEGGAPLPFVADLRDKKVADLRIALTPPAPQAQSPGVVKGKVVVLGDNDQPLENAEGVKVGIGGSQLIAITAPDGSFKIEQVPPGTYTVVAMREGYEPARQEGVDVQPGQTVDIGELTIEPKRDYPRVVATDPPDGTKNVTVGFELPVKIRFSKPMDADSVRKAIRIEPEANYRVAIGAGSHPEAADHVAVVVLNNDDENRPIKYNTRYVVVVGREAADASGLRMRQEYRFSFVTGAPGIFKTRPADGEMNAPNLPIVVFFNTRIQQESFNLNTVRFRPRLDVDPQFVFDTDARTGWTIVRILARLEPEKTYTVTIGRGVRSTTNQPLSNTPYTWRFRIQAPPQVVPVEPPLVR